MFRVGDVVRLTRTDEVDLDNGLEVGDLGVIRRIDRHGDYYLTWFRLGVVDLYFYTDQMEKVNAEDGQPTTKNW